MQKSQFEQHVKTVPEGTTLPCQICQKNIQTPSGLNTHMKPTYQYTEVRFSSLLSGGFTTMAVINPPEKKLANRTSVHWQKKYQFH